MIQILRGTSAQRADQTQTSTIGQPLYETDTGRLYVGDGETGVNELEPIVAKTPPTIPSAKTHLTWTCIPIDGGLYDSAGTFSGEDIFTDGKNIYAIWGQNMAIWDKSTEKFYLYTGTVSGIPSSGLYGRNAWTDGKDTFITAGMDYGAVYKFDTDSMAFSAVDSDDSFTGADIWSWHGYLFCTDDAATGENYRLDGDAENGFTCTSITMNVSSNIISQGRYIWTDGNDIFYDEGNYHYKLNQETSTINNLVWEPYTINSTTGGLGTINLSGDEVFSDGQNICWLSKPGFTSPDLYIYTLKDGKWNSQTIGMPTVNNLSLNGRYVFTDGENFYIKSTTSNSDFKITRRTDTSSKPLIGYEYGNSQSAVIGDSVTSGETYYVVFSVVTTQERYTSFNDFVTNYVDEMATLLQTPIWVTPCYIFNSTFSKVTLSALYVQGTNVIILGPQKMTYSQSTINSRAEIFTFPESTSSLYKHYFNIVITSQ